MSVLQNKRFRTGIGIGAVLLAAAAIGLGSYAAFSDVETGPGGQIQSGTLDLEVGNSTPATLFNATNIAPGFTQDVVVTLNNVGSLPGSLTSTLNATSADVTCTEPERAEEGTPTCAGNLHTQMQVAVIPPGSTTPSAAVPLNTLTTLPTVNIPAATGSTPGTVSYTLRLSFPSQTGTVNNAAQGDSVTLTSNFTLSQV
jgi:spore coat-associated protein N